MGDQLERAKRQVTCMHVPFKGEGGPVTIMMCQNCYLFWLKVVRAEAMEETGNLELAKAEIQKPYSV